MWNSLVAISTLVTFLTTMVAAGDHVAFPAAGAQSVKRRRSTYDHTADDVPLSVSDDTMEVQMSARIPLDLLNRMSCMHNVSQFVDELIDKESLDPREIAGHFGEEEVERGIAKIPQPGVCTPEMTLVSLIPKDAPNDASIVYYPECTRIKQCGGCCARLLSCQPIETETLTFTILKSQYTGGNRMMLKEKIPVIVEQHTKCKCGCAVKEEHCNRNQKYESNQCKCICTNLEDQSKCLKEDLKIWDTVSCTCRCRESKSCTTGSYFDENNCQCLQLPIFRPTDQAILDRKKFIIKAQPINPGDNSRYHTVPPEYPSPTPWDRYF